MDAAAGVFLLTGISASGKSTVAQLLAQRFERAVHVRGDVFRRMVVSGRQSMRPGASPEAHRQLDLRYRLGASASDAYFEAGFTVVVQDVVLGEYLKRYVAYIRSRPLYVVVLSPRVDVVANREASRPKTAYRPGRIGPEELDEILRNRTPRIGLWTDNSDQTPEETANEILRRKAEAAV